MDRSLRKTADAIVRAGIEAVLPDAAVARALERFDPGGGRVVLVAAGKAAWQMARAALDCLGHVDAGIVITKYGHVRGELPGVVCCEAGHPVPDQAGFDATRRALALVQGLAARDRVLFLLSGGGQRPAGTAPSARRPVAGYHPAASGLRGGYRGDQHHPQAAVRRQGRAVRAELRSSPGVQRGAQRYFGRPSGHDRLGAGLSRPLHLRRGRGHRRQVCAAPFAPGPGPAGPGDPPSPWTTSPPASPAACGSCAAPPPQPARPGGISRCCSPTASPARPGRRDGSWGP